MIRKTLLALSLTAALTTPAFAGDYQIAGLEPDILFAVDLASLKSAGPYIQATYLTAFTPPDISAEGNAYSYTVSTADFDCDAGNYRRRQLAGFSDKHLPAFHHDNTTEWIGVVTGSYMEDVFNIVCGTTKQTIDFPGQSAESMVDRFIALDR